MPDGHSKSRHEQTLTRHRDIQAWALQRNGAPAIVRSPDRMGQMRARLALRFADLARPRGMPQVDPQVDQGASPVSWSAWFAELDRQQLALRVSADDETGYELIERKALN
jgi:hypothetical protein